MPAAALHANTGLRFSLRKSTKGEGYFFNHKALDKVFLAKFLAGVRRRIVPLNAPSAQCKRKGFSAN
jgi:hypothetical protein